MRSLAHESFDPELEAELRATLRRKADDLEPNLPTWEDLIRDSEAVVVSLRTGRPLLDGRIQGRRRAWIRPLLAAAVSLALAMAAGVVIGRAAGNDPAGQADGTTDPDEAEDAQIAADSSTPPDLIAPGEASFRASEPEILYPFGANEAALRAEVREAVNTEERRQELAELAMPEVLARRYLLDTLMITEPEDPYDPAPMYELWTDPPLPEAYGYFANLDGETVETTSVWWSLRDPERPTSGGPAVVTQGSLFLRNLADPGVVNGPDAWVVTGVSTQGTGVLDVARTGDELTFTLQTNVLELDVIDPSDLQPEVLVNGVQVPGDGPDPAWLSYRAPVAATDSAVILVRYMSSGVPVSLVAVAFPPVPEAPLPPSVGGDVVPVPTAPPTERVASTTTVP